MSNKPSNIPSRLENLFVASGVTATKLTPSTDIKNDLGMDSLDQAEIVMRIEKEFNITVNNSEWESLISYQSLIELIEKKSPRR